MAQPGLTGNTRELLSSICHCIAQTEPAFFPEFLGIELRPCWMALIHNAMVSFELSANPSVNLRIILEPVDPEVIDDHQSTSNPFMSMLIPFAAVERENLMKGPHFEIMKAMDRSQAGTLFAHLMNTVYVTNPCHSLRLGLGRGGNP